jgi:hypothetical protein
VLLPDKVKLLLLPGLLLNEFLQMLIVMVPQMLLLVRLVVKQLGVMKLRQ